QRIQEKVRATRGASAPRQSAIVAGSLEIPRWQALEDSLARAQDVAHVGAALPAMSRIHGLKRTVATGVAKAFLRIAQLITRDQRTFNLTALDASRFLYERARDDAAQIAAARAEIASVREQAARLRAALSLQERRLDAVAERATSVPETTAEAAPEPTAPGSPRVSDATYLHFEDEFRGSREMIKERAVVYLPLLRAAAAQTNDAPILDLGCGRGELLEVLRTEGLRASGVDANRVAVEQCRALGLDVELRDVFEALRGIGNATLGGVTAMHLVEHLPFPQVVLLLDEMIRVLRPGGIAILETPNTQNVLVGSCNFYIDPTHRNPVHPRTLRFLMEARGLDRVETMMLHPSAEQRVADSDSELARRFNEYFYGPQDFAAIGYRP
ncbi:MAG TPA: class I SAM-dependent methyltransferase, partial [Myxococcales bacterium]|nr:class I SAM-dependent methyltransferase [Myxococcales bacterium]